jgi:enoyl-CoA hydratase/carnithine racemase
VREEGSVTGLPEREYETLLVEQSHGIFTITLNRPSQLNAINATMSDELLGLWRALREDDHPDVRVVVITGAGEGFCSGADLSADAAAARPHPLQMMRKTADLALTLHTLPQVTIAKVNGIAAGAGCNLALSCDLIVASNRARFSEIFARRGLSLDFGGAWLLPRLIGLHRAKELALFADVLDADDALRFGIVNRVVDQDDLEMLVSEWGTRLGALAPTALAQTKALLNDAIAPSVADLLEFEAFAQTINFRTDDANEAMLAWRDKRSPEFKGL